MKKTNSMFSELYSIYYSIVAEILSEAVEGTLTKDKMYKIINENGFDETILTIPEKLVDGDWRLLDTDLSTPLLDKPQMPLTNLQTRWLKTIMSDPRIRLFVDDFPEMYNINPLFSYDDIIYFDRNNDGDPYDDDKYIDIFKTILRTIHNEKYLNIKYISRQNNEISVNGYPLQIEYSGKDDKFRLILGTSASGSKTTTINIASITECVILSSAYAHDADCDNRNSQVYNTQPRELVVRLTDERNTLDRLLLEFSYLERETRQIDDNHYMVTMKYNSSDEATILIKILSFGPTVQVISPDSMIEKIKERLLKQISRSNL